MEFSDLKIDKRIAETLSNNSIGQPNAIQKKVLKRFIGGQDFTLVASEGLGKSTTIILGIIQKLKYAKGDAPRALVLLPNKEKVEEINLQFEKLAKHTDLRSLELFAGRGLQGQKDIAFDGVDVVFGTPDRVLSVYLKSGLNLGNIQIFGLDDADLIVKQGLQSAIWRLSESLPKCQHIVFTNVYHEKISRLTEAFLFDKNIIEIEEELSEKFDTIPQYYFQLPNFISKLNLLNLLLRDQEELQRVVVYCNTKLTASKLYKTLVKWHEGEIAILNSMFFEQKSFKSLEEFKLSSARILIVANEEYEEEDFINCPFSIQFDIPENYETVVNRLKLSEFNKETESIVFCSDIELSLLRKIENSTGRKMEMYDTPEGIEEQTSAKKKPKKTSDEEVDTGAFHEKKAKNSKDYNFNLRDKREKAGKKQKRRHT